MSKAFWLLSPLFSLSVLGDAWAAPQPSIVVRAQPSLVLLGEDGDQKVHLDIVLNLDQEERVALEDLILHSTAGEISDLERKGPFQFTALLHPPKSIFPQLSVVTVAYTKPALRGDPPWVGVAAISYSAALNLKGRSEPGARMRVRVGKKTFGPVKADSRGQFELRVVVPPGEGWARSTATDALGNASSSRINLYLPEVQRVHAFAFPQHLIADGEDRGWLYVTTVGHSGAPKKSRLEAKAERGTLGEHQQVAPGLTRIAYRTPITLADGRDLVGIRARSFDAKAEVTFSLIAGAPTVIQTTLRPDPPTADGRSEATLLVEIRDRHGNPAAGHALELSNATPNLPLSLRAPGSYTLSLPPKSSFARETIAFELTPQSPDCPRPRLVSQNGTQKLVDVRGIPCPHEPRASLALVEGQALAGKLRAEHTIRWRLPTEVDLRIEVTEKRKTAIVLRIEARGIDTLGERIALSCAQGQITVVGTQDNAITAHLPLAADGPKEFDVLARDRTTGVSAWARIVP